MVMRRPLLLGLGYARGERSAKTWAGTGAKARPSGAVALRWTAQLFAHIPFSPERVPLGE
jgi:hypothetical protein